MKFPKIVNQRYSSSTKILLQDIEKIFNKVDHKNKFGNYLI